MSLPDPPIDINATLDRTPFGSATGLRSHSCTAASSATTALAPGGYVAYLTGTVDGVAHLGATAVAPTADAADELAGAFLLPAGVPTTFSIGGASNVALHVILLSAGTQLVYLMRVA